MNGERHRRTITVTNPQGLHMRPLQAFVEATKQFQAEICVQKKGQTERFNGRSMSQLLLLNVEHGQEVTVEAEGPDAAQAVERLCQILLTIPAEDA